MGPKVNKKCAKCGITSAQDSALSFHRFPRPSERGSLRAKVWAKYCFPDEDWNSNESLKVLRNQYYICSKHFDNSSYTSSDRSRLNAYAIPINAQYILCKLRDECGLPKATMPCHLEEQTPRVESTCAEKHTGTVEHQVSNVDIDSADKQTEAEIYVPEDSQKADVVSREEGTNETVPIWQEAENTEPNVELFSWEVTNRQELIPHDEPERTDDVPDDLSMYCDDDDDDVALERAKGIDETVRHDGFHCDNCKGDIVGHRYTCVQCNNLDLCVACETGGAHAHHYMLRVPGPRPYNEIQTVLARIRRHLMKEFDPISSAIDQDNEDAVSVKSEIKSEDEGNDIEVLEEMDTLAAETVKTVDDTDCRLWSPESKCPQNEDSEVVAENKQQAVQQQMKTLTEDLVSQDENQRPVVVESINDMKTRVPSTAKRKVIVHIPDSPKPKVSNQLAKKILVIPGTSQEKLKTIDIITGPKAMGPNQSKLKYVTLPPGALLKRGQTVSLQISYPQQQQTNVTDGKS